MEMNELMAQAQELQTKVAQAQELLSVSSVKGIAGNGLCIIDMTGKYELKNMVINPDLLKEPLDKITAVISAAFNDAKVKADDLIDRVMGEATEGMQIPNE